MSVTETPSAPHLDAERRLRKKLVQAVAYVDQTEVERKRLKVFLILAATTWPLGLFFHWLWCIAISASWMLFFVVGVYLSFFHRRNARGRVDDLTRELQSLGVIVGSDG